MSEAAGPSTKLWREAFHCFERIAELTRDSHEAELRKVETERPDLYPHLVTLLRAHREVQAGDFMTRPREPSIDELRRGASSDALPGKEFGPYRLERQLGRGGMGEVWLARRADGLFEAPVALKLLHPHLEASATRDRFVREGKILGQLSHPHIARLLDAGSLPPSRLYLAIEYVEGDRIDLWCDLRRLTIEARVRLFLQVCEAVAHAHTRLVVHRDLKPSNIMVTANGEVKLLDFGIAKLIESEETSSEATDLTRVGGRVMTPEYAAPEQILGAPVTTATDVYSLGMVLYVLLTGRRPYGADGASLAQLEREVVEVDPDPPSHYRRATGVVTATDAASLRGMTGTQLRSALRGDLDTIVLKALKKAPAERYASVADFGEDLRRFVENRPVLAQPDSAGYRFRKFVRRNRVGVTAAAAVAIAIVAGVAGVVYQAREARIAQHAAEAAQAQAVDSAARVKRSKDFFVGIFSSASPLYRQGEGPQTVQQAFDDAVKSVEALSDDPRFQGDLLSDFGEIRAGQGDVEGAKKMFERALALHEKTLAPDDPVLANTLQNRGVIESYLADAAQGIPYLERAVQILEKHPDTHGDALTSARTALATAYAADGQRDRALALDLAVLEQARASPGPQERNLAVILSTLGVAYHDVENFAEAKRYFTEALAVWERNYGPDTPNLGVVLKGLSQIAFYEGDDKASAAYARRWLAMIRKQYPTPNQETLVALRAVTETEIDAHDWGEAEPRLREMIEVGRTLERTHPDQAWAGVSLAWLEWDRDRADVALQLQAEAGRLCAGMAHHDRTSSCPHADGLRARLLVLFGRPEEALTVARGALSQLEAADNLSVAEATPARLAQGEAAWALGRREEALSALRAVLADSDKGTRSTLGGVVRRRLASFLVESGGDANLAAATKLLKDARPRAERAGDTTEQLFVEAHLALARGRRDEALRLARASLEECETRRPWTDRAARITREWLVQVEGGATPVAVPR